MARSEGRARAGLRAADVALVAAADGAGLVGAAGKALAGGAPGAAGAGALTGTEPVDDTSLLAVTAGDVARAGAPTVAAVSAAADAPRECVPSAVAAAAARARGVGRRGRAATGLCRSSPVEASG